jgi:hypothetical protein
MSYYGGIIMNSTVENTDVPNGILLDNYLGLLNTLSLEYKMQLAARLMHNISEEFTDKKPFSSIADSVNKFYGAWQSVKSAEDMIAEIREGRRNSQRIVRL